MGTCYGSIVDVETDWNKPCSDLSIPNSYASHILIFNTSDVEDKSKSDAVEDPQSSNIKRKGPVEIACFPVQYQDMFFKMDSALGTFFPNDPPLVKEKTENPGVILQFPNNEYYLGGWYRQQRWGLGKLAIKDDCVYEGYFKEDLPNGPGRLITAQGNIMTGIFSNGQLEGNGTFINSSGVTITGVFKDGVLQGLGNKCV